MKIKPCLNLMLLLASGLLCAAANAATWQQLVPSQANDGEIDLPPAGFTAVYSVVGPVAEIWFAPDVSPQSPANVAAEIEAQFAVPLTLVGQNDSFGSSDTVSHASGFDVLAVHLGGAGGGNTLLFFFDTLITDFDVDTFSQGGSSNLSNYRAYSVVPLPAAVWLMISGLFGLGLMRRRK